MKKWALILALVFLAATARAATFQPTVNPLLPTQNSPLASSTMRLQFGSTYNDLVSVAGLIQGGVGTVTGVTCSITSPASCVVTNPTSTPNVGVTLPLRGSTGTSFQMALGTTTSGNCAKFDGSSNLIDAGTTCGGGGSGGTPGGSTNAIQINAGASTFGGLSLTTTGQILIGTDGAGAISPFSLSGDGTLSGAGALTISKVNGVAYGTSPSTNTVPVVTSSNTITYETVPNAALANSAITFGATSQALGSTVTNFNAVNVGPTSRGTGAFTTLAANSTVTFSGISGSTQCLHVDSGGVVTGTGSDCGSGGGGTAFSAFTAATTTNSINNGSNGQIWNWNVLGANTALSLLTTGLSSGKILDVENTSNTNATGYAGYFSNVTTGLGYALYAQTTGASNTGYAGYFKNPSASGYAVFADGRVTMNNTVALSALTTGALTVNGTGVAASGTLANSFLTNSSVTISPGTGLTGGGSVALGATTTLSLTSPVTVANGGTGLTSGTSGGVPTYTASGTITSSGALTANLPVIGGGAGAVVSVGSRTGNSTLYATSTGSQTSGNLVSIDANGNHIAAGISSSNQQIRAISYTIDGGGSTITTGVKGDLYVPMACTITSATLLADQSGSIVVNVWKIAYASYPATVSNKITASAPPTISSAVKAQDSTLTGWTTSISAGDTLRFNVDSATTITRVTLVLACNAT